MAKLVSDFDEVESVHITEDSPVEISLTGMSETPQIAIVVEGPQGPPSNEPGPAGPPGQTGPVGPKGDSSVSRTIPYNVAIPSDEWHLVHDLGNPHPDVNVFDNNGEAIFADVTYPSPTEVVVKFAYEMTGMVQLG
jgi:hypothetical protein